MSNTFSWNLLSACAVEVATHTLVCLGVIKHALTFKQSCKGPACVVSTGEVRTCTDGDLLRETAVESSPPPSFPRRHLKAAPMFSLGQEDISTSPASTKGPVKYGELIVLG